MSTPPAFKPSEGKREEFRKYLEKTGVMDTLTKVLVSLYEEAEKPEDALAFIRDRLAVQAGIETYAELLDKIEELKTQINELENKLQDTQANPPSEEGGSKVEEVAETVENNQEVPAESEEVAPSASGNVDETAPPPDSAPEAPAEEAQPETTTE